MSSFPSSLPGIGSALSLAYRGLFTVPVQSGDFAPGGSIIDGANARDAGNSPVTQLRPGYLLGQITASGLLGGSVLGLTTTALGSGQTTLNVSAATAVEIARRQGTSGTFTLTGANTVSAAAVTRTVTYSAVNTTTGAVTITALGEGAVSTVNAVEALHVVEDTGSGTFTLTFEGVTTAAITYSATYGTLTTNINNALNATFGTSIIVCSGGSLDALILTFSGLGVAGRPVGHVTSTLAQGGTGVAGGMFTINGSASVGTTTTTTAGVVAVTAQGDEFLAGSFVGPTDGSQVPVTLFCGDLTPIDVVDINGASVSVPFRLKLLAPRQLNTANIVNYPPATYTGLKNWLKAALRVVVPGLPFSDDMAF